MKKENKRVVIITGAAQGIGRAIALRCLKNGWRVVACDKNVAKLKMLSTSPLLIPLMIDVSCYDNIEKCFVALKDLKIEPDSLVNNAGIFLGKKLANYTPDDVDLVINTNLKSAIYFSQYFGSLLISKKREGTIVNVASVAGHVGSSDPIYGLSKAGILNLTKSCAMEFAPYIRVNAIAPTIVSTDLMKAVPASRLQAYRELEIIKEPLSAESVADAIWFLLNNESGHFTGSTLDVNNGFLLR